MVSPFRSRRPFAARVHRGASALLASAGVWLVATSCAPGAMPPNFAANRRLVERYFEEVWNGGNVNLLDELLDPAYVNHTPSVPDPAPGPDGLKPIVRGLREAFPDLHYTIDDVIVTGDRVVARVTMTGTHRGPLFGLAPTGRRVRVMQMNIERIQGGRIIEHWRVTDELTLMQQLGVVPPSPGQAPLR